MNLELLQNFLGKITIDIQTTDASTLVITTKIPILSESVLEMTDELNTV